MLFLSRFPFFKIIILIFSRQLFPKLRDKSSAIFAPSTENTKDKEMFNSVFQRCQIIGQLSSIEKLSQVRFTR